MAKSDTIESTDITPPATEQVGDATPAKTGEQSLTPDFAKLSATTHEVTPGARLPDSVGGADAEAKRGAGRPRMTEEEREAAKERKRQRDRERHRKNKGGSKPAPAESGSDDEMDLARANAAMVVAALEMVGRAIGGEEYQPSNEQRAATHGAWAHFLQEEGITMPPWATVTFVSIAHIAPAFATPKGRGVISGIWAKARAWWALRRG